MLTGWDSDNAGTPGPLRSTGGVLKSLPRRFDSLYRNSLFSVLGDPDTEEAKLRSISPLYHADRIVKPLLVLQGADDTRVPRRESEEMVEAVRKHGGTAECVVFEDEGHGFTKRANVVYAYRRVLEFLDRHLKKRAAGSCPPQVERSTRTGSMPSTLRAGT